MKKLLIAAGLVIALGVAVAVGGIIFWMLRSDEVALVTEAPTITPSGSLVVTNNTGGVLHFVIVPEESEVTYVAREKLAQLPLSSNAVGKTSAISGDIYLTREGLVPGQTSAFRVDLRTLKSDESRRDNYIRQNGLQSDQFPFAEFVIESVDAFPAEYVEGTEVSLVLTGRMTIRGTERPLTFQVKARQVGDTLSAVADTEFNMTDFGVDPPNIPFVTVEDHLQLQVVLVARLGQGS